MVNQQLIVSRSINHKSKEFIVINILEGAFNFSCGIKSIEFSIDSEQKIFRNNGKFLLQSVFTAFHQEILSFSDIKNKMFGLI